MIKKFTPVGQGLMCLDINGTYCKVKDVLKLIDEIDATPISAIMRNNRLEDLKARITG